MATATVKVENQTSSNLFVCEVNAVNFANGKKTSVGVSNSLATVKSNRTGTVNALQTTVLLITNSGEAAKNKAYTLQSQDILFEVGTSGGNVLVGSGTTLTKALMWAFFALMIALIIVVIVLLVVHFKRVHKQDEVAASAADALVAANDATKAHPPAAVPAKAFTQGHQS